LTRSRYAIHALDWIFQYPIFRSADFTSTAGTAERTARRVLDVLCEGSVLRIINPGSGRRTTVLAFPALLNVAEEQAGVLTVMHDRQHHSSSVISTTMWPSSRVVDHTPATKCRRGTTQPRQHP
jgi:hypothetical protein